MTGMFLLYKLSYSLFHRAFEVTVASFDNCSHVSITYDNGLPQILDPSCLSAPSATNVALFEDVAFLCEL